ncbi:MAG TPA: AAA family ATPase [Saccharofermentans sp.]|nr:AAA family ATPase [Saccharofermentans sp.]HPQ32300.1 AAA family ATPase [Saccharofermentans sp.]
MINKITIENFKSIEKIQLNLKQINILVGGNNSGKTSILQALQFGCSIIQTINITSVIPWQRKGDYSRSIEPGELVYSPLKDVSALAIGGKLKQGDKYTIKLSYFNEDSLEYKVSIKQGKNRNIVATINKSDLAKQFTSLDRPVCVYVPGLAGIPYNEEYKSEGLVRKAAAKGDANSVLRNILYLLSKTSTDWNNFNNTLKSMFPNISISILYNEKTDDYIDISITEEIESTSDTGAVIKNTRTLPLDAVGTGVLQAIQILSYIYVYHPQVLILDEPDAHLHPNNQRKILDMLFSIAVEKEFQLIISTHSRHVIDASDTTANIMWVKNGKCIEEDIDYIKILLDLGALDSGDLLKNGLIKCVFLTEDSTDRKMLETVIEASGFNLSETDIWSYNGCTKVDSALILAEFIKKHAPSASIVIHRDRDYMTTDEIQDYKDKICVNGNNCFITLGSDIESYYLSPEHIHNIFSDIPLSDAQSIIQEATNIREDESIKIFIDSRFRTEQTYYRKDGKNFTGVGKLSHDCHELYHSNPKHYRHGKMVYRELKNQIQKNFKKNPNDLLKQSESLSDPSLNIIAKEIWK